MIEAVLTAAGVAAALLDLRISTLFAELHAGELHVGADATRPCLRLQLPRH